MSQVRFYCVSSAAYFLGAVGMINSLRLVGHDEPVEVLEFDLDDRQRELLGREATIVSSPPGTQPWLLKTVAPLSHPAEVMVLIDADMIVTRPLDELIERAAEGRVLAVEHGKERNVPAWGEVLDLGRVRPQTYVSSGLVVAGGAPGRELIELLDDRQQRVEFERGYLAADEPGYPLRYLDQDVLNAILASRIQPEAFEVIDRRLEAIPPFDGLRLVDESSLRVSYEDGLEPFTVHHHSAKPWSELTPEGVYTRLLRRLLTGEDVAIQVSAEELPRHMREGFVGTAIRSWVSRRNLFRERPT